MDWVLSEGAEAPGARSGAGALGGDRSAVDGPLVGAGGQDFVAATLGTLPPAEAVAEIHRRCGVADPRVASRLGLLAALGVSGPQVSRVASGCSG